MSEESNLELQAAEAAVQETRQQMEPHFVTVGKVCYPSVRDNPPAEAAGAIAALKVLEQTLEQQLDECDRIRGSVTCPACGAEVPYGSRFCNYCGVKLGKQSTIGQPQLGAAEPEQPAAEPVKIQHCIYCGKEMEQGDKYCMYCGRAQ